MAELNRLNSPMRLLKENIYENSQNVQFRKKLLEEKQYTKSAFVVGSIEEMSRRICQLDKQVQAHTGVVTDRLVTSGADQVLDLTRQQLVWSRSGLKASEQSLPSRLSNVSNLSTNQRQPKIQTGNQDDNGKPRLIELWEYAGFDSQAANPLPWGLKPVDVLSKLRLQHLCHKQSDKSSLLRLLFSPVSQALLQDIFWYLFLDKFQPNPASQEKLFDRVSHTYVSLLMSSAHLDVRDIFLQDYPKLMSQAVYSAFCCSFPDSYLQFGETFKDSVASLVFGWMAGIQPAPRCWLVWDLASLEPQSLALRHKAHKESSSIKKTNSFGKGVTSTQRSLRQTPGQEIRDVRHVSFHRTVKESNRAMPFNDSRAESHPFGKGCNFKHTVFDMEGHSPLVQHFMRVQDLHQETGQTVWLHRVQLDKLPPLDAKTYRDFIDETLHNMQDRRKKYLKTKQDKERVSRVLINQQKDLVKQHLLRQASLLAKEKEVKRLSDLIIQEMRRGKDSVSAGAALALTSALMAQD